MYSELDWRLQALKMCSREVKSYYFIGQAESLATSPSLLRSGQLTLSKRELNVLPDRETSFVVGVNTVTSECTILRNRRSFGPRRLLTINPLVPEFSFKF
jgi:hypothetical protein